MGQQQGGRRTQSGKPDEAAVEQPFISAGVASDLEMQGWAGDPTTGGMFRKDEDGVVTFTPREGKTITLA
jgi:hypothetical protein